MVKSKSPSPYMSKMLRISAAQEQPTLIIICAKCIYGTVILRIFYLFTHKLLSMIFTPISAIRGVETNNL